MSNLVLSVTPVYAGLLGLLFALLTFNVIRLRWRERVSLLDGGKTVMIQAIRAQGNFIETVPLGLLLMAFAEINGLPAPLLHALGAFILVGRSLHALGVLSSAGVTKRRVWGMVMTMSGIVGAAVSILYLYAFA